MKVLLLACKVFQPELEFLLPTAELTPEVRWIELGEHARPAKLRKKLQQAIDEAQDQYDLILLAYGLCGRATDQLKAGKTPVILCRCHDCCGILLGSKQRFKEIFSEMPSTPFSSAGYQASGEYYFSDGELITGDGYEALVEEYGEDNARYVWEMMHPSLHGQPQLLYYIEPPELPNETARQRCRERAREEQLEFRELQGNLRLLKMLINGPWPEEDFLYLAPGMSVQQTGDWDEIIRAVNVSS